MPVSQEDFRTALSRFASGVCVVTAIGGGGEFYAITVSAFCSVSLTPPLILVCIEKSTNSHRGLTASDHFVVNMLTDEQVEISERFALPSPADLGGIKFDLTNRGIPMLADTIAALECRRVAAHDAGDHTVFVGEVEASRIGAGRPLLYFKGGYAAMV